MKKYFVGLAFLTAAAAWLAFGFSGAAQTKADADVVSTTLVISQFQTGRASPNFEDEFVEIHNVSAASVDLNGYRLVYRADNPTDIGPFATWTTSTVVPPGGYYLIASTNYDGSIPADITYNPSSCACSMSGTRGGLAIRNGPNNTGTIIDSVVWGIANNGFTEGMATTPHPIDANDNSKLRLQNGCQDTDNNANDFATQTPSQPRNTASGPFLCAGGGTVLSAAMSANPSSVAPGSTTLLTVTVVPAVTPPSTGITVVGNLTDIGGAASQTFYDDGTHGDVTAGDNVFSFLATVANGTSVGVHGVSAVASDLQGRTAPVQTNINVTGTLPDEDPLTFGNPSNATPDVGNETNYLMVKPQYSLSYHRNKGEPNWVAWRLDSSWIGSAPRQDDYRPDPALPAAWYHVQANDYSGTIYERGHMCPSGDRTRSIPDNSATFLMTNFLPQIGENNEGPWADLENYCRTLASQGNEMYIIAGGAGNAGTIANGHVQVPTVTWKVVLVLPNGSDDVHRVTRSTRAFGVIMSNVSISQSAPWRNFRTTVDAVEYLTGYDFFSAIPKNTQELIERHRDRL
jgi:endonuclease G, mitochondrial